MKIHENAVKSVVWWQMLCFYIIILTLRPVLRRYHSQGLNGETLLRSLRPSLPQTPESILKGLRESSLKELCTVQKLE